MLLKYLHEYPEIDVPKMSTRMFATSFVQQLVLILVSDRNAFIQNTPYFCTILEESRALYFA